MKQLLLISLFICSTWVSHAQEKWVDIAETNAGKAYDEGQKLYNEKNYAAAAGKYREALLWSPQTSVYYSSVATCYYFLGEYAKAHPLFKEAFMLEPGNASYVIDYIMSIVLNNGTLEDVKPLIGHFVQLSAIPGMEQESLNAMKEMPLQSKPQVHAQVVEWFQQKRRITPPIAAFVFSRVEQVLDYIKNDQIDLFDKTMNEVGKKMDSLRNPYNILEADIYSIVARELALFGYVSKSKIYADKCLAATKLNPSFTANQASIAAIVLTDYHRHNGDFQGALQQLTLWKNMYASQPIPAYTRFEVMQMYPFLHANLKQYKDAVAAAQALPALATGYKGPYYQIEINNAMLKAYVKGPTQQEVQKALVHGNTALTLAQQANYVGLIPGIRSNIAYAYHNSGNTDAAIRQYEELVKFYETQRKHADVELTLNNIGGLLWKKKRYQELVPILERTINIQDQIIRSVTPDVRLYYFDNTVSPYIWLAAAQAMNKQVEASILTIEKSRGRVLLEKMGVPASDKPLTLADLQKNIHPKEVVIYYTEVEPGKMLIQTISATGATAVLHDFTTLLKSIKLQYQPFLSVISEIESQKRMRKNTYYNTKVQYVPRDPLVAAYMNDAVSFQKEDFSLFVELFRYCLAPPDEETEKVLEGRLKPFAQLLFSTLIQPVASALTGKEQVTLLPDGALNFIPFETLITPTGKYLGEQYNIRYGNSIRILQQLEQRVYTTGRKPVLAMGGAIYEEMKTKAPLLREEEELAELNQTMLNNSKANRSQRYVLARLGYGKMDYLIGTLNEVNAIKQVVPAAEIFTGEEMTEKRLKAMSASGELAKYKVLHLATHGWSNNIIPKLSGVAMCIPPTEVEGEDGYLFTYEMAELKLKADMVMLSACETGLGKLYNGEGVVGLTQALLSAGANSTLVSLWPVNDYSTSVLVAETYRLVFQQNLSYRDALWTVKKNMIKGVYNKGAMDLSKPEYWSPFIFYGR